MFPNLSFFVCEIVVISPINPYNLVMRVTLKDLTYAKHFIYDKFSINSGYNVHRIDF